VGLARDADLAELVLKDGGYPFPKVGRPTLWQFTFDLDTGWVRAACAQAGVFAFFACLATRGDERVGHARSPLTLVPTLAACFVVAMIITVLHTPSHH
jgi:hypothetical protein